MPARREAAELAEVRAHFLGATDPAQAVPPALLESWRRSKAALGVPGNVRDVPRVDEDLLDNHLLDMFAAPLARVSEDLDGTGMGLLLADAQGRIVQRWTHDRAAVSYLDRLGTVRGALLAEDAVGTNGVGTAIVTGKSVQIAGAEHFADMYQYAVCTGAPVFHPITGKLVAVVTVSTTVEERSGLLLPMTKSVAAQLEQHALDVAQPGAKAMLAAFLEASTRFPGPVVAFGPDGLTMRNQRAGALTQTDIDTIGHRCAGIRHSGRLITELSIGPTSIEIVALSDGAGVIALLESARRPTVPGHARPRAAGLVGAAKPWRTAAHHVSRHVATRQPLVIAGEAGVGKVSLALGRPHVPSADPDGAVVKHAAERHIIGNRQWLQQLSDVLCGPTPVIVRGIDGLDGPTTAALRTLIERNAGATPILATTTVATRAGGEALAAQLGVSSVWVPPLRERVGDIPALWQSFAVTRAPGAGLELTAEAQKAAAGYAWPGNLTELRTVVEGIAAAGKRGPVRPEDLPEIFRGTRALSMIERTELEAIRRALAEADGNRSKAAEILGVSRATIHRKMKAYHITV